MDKRLAFKGGENYGKLTVVKYAGNALWECSCSCGNTVLASSPALKRGDTKSCGCLKKEVRSFSVGEHINSLTVISFDKTKKRWLCKCDCGNTLFVTASNIKKGSTKSCGCKRPKRYKEGDTVGNLTIVSYAGNASYLCRCSCGNEVTVKTSSLITGNTTTCGCGRYTQTRSLACRLNKHVASIVEAEYKLFGTKLKTVSKEQFAQLKAYFELNEKRSISYSEKELLSFVRSIYSGLVIENDRKAIRPKELDIYIPEKNLAVEFNGLWWHTTKYHSLPSYHLDKTKECRKKGIRLIHIFENEWRDKQDIVKSMLASALGVYEKKIYARNCTVKEVCNKEEVKKLFDENHIQGSVARYQKCIGLYYNNALVQACIFGIQHFGEKNSIELYRMVTLKNTQVVGGFSKIMAHCGYDRVISYVSLKHFDAKGYLLSGWKIDGVSRPSFSVTDGTNVYSRHLFKKEAMLKRFSNITPDMKEREMQELNGYYRIWDCGTYRVVWSKH